MKLLNTNTIAIVVNSNIPQSTNDAIWYCQQRNIPVNNIISVNFANSQFMPLSDLFTVQTPNNITVQSGTYAGHAIGQALAAQIANGTVQSVIVSTYTPSVVTCNVGSGAGTINPYWGVASFLGASVYFNSVSTAHDNVASVPLNVNPTALVAQMNGNVTIQNTNAFFSFNAASVIATANNLYVPCGRLGFPDNSKSYATEIVATVTSFTLPGETLFQRAVRLAKAAEANSNYLQSTWVSLDQTSNGAGTFNFYSQNVNIATYQSAVNKGMPNLVYVTYEATNTAASLVNINDLVSGNVTNPLPLFAYAVTGGTNGATNTGNNYVTQPGAWGCSWYSFSFELLSTILANGGSCVISTVSEPYGEFIAYPCDIFYQAVTQHCELMVCNWWSRTNQVGGGNCNLPIGTCAYGDPLYAPYLVPAQQLSGFSFKGIDLIFNN